MFIILNNCVIDKVYSGSIGVFNFCCDCGCGGFNLHVLVMRKTRTFYPHEIIELKRRRSDEIN